MFNTIIFPVIYGLVIFLAGMKIMETALGSWAGPLLSSFLRKATSSPLKGMLFSTGITAILQSSTAVTVLTMGLVNAGLLAYERTLGIILGTNIGTCITTELIGLQIGQIALPLLGVSGLAWTLAVIADEYKPFFMRACAHLWRPIQLISLAIAGFALVMLGIRVMQMIGPPLENTGLFGWFIAQAAHNVWWGITAGAVLTALMHSSAAVIGLAIALAASGTLPVGIGIAIVLGANVGTCVTAVIAAIGSTKSGQFVAWTHVVLNLGGALLFMPFIEQLQWLSAALSADDGAQIARAQTLFNIICSAAALPLCYLPIWRKLRIGK
ncbi:Na/Pi cotransporter family protein [Paenibacillus donghaensis]|uniref:Na/Pi cotransporter family protein n=1 Tax=Paenibacillus donghaensis TaxID=414771 RepID=UPI00188350E9|nr:Na/Pi symporter [Paenibacillus donghaensis]MBE9912826.1 Na/Pi cotransporter family protein [Paenibacillus donghaensis]